MSIRATTPIRTTQPPARPFDLTSLFSEYRQLEAMREEMRNSHKEYLDKLDAKLEELDATIQQVQQIQKGEKGEPGYSPKPGVDFPIPKDGESVSHEKVVQDVLKNIRQPKDGQTPIIDYKKIAEAAAKLVPAPQPGKDGQAPTLKEIVEFLKENLKVEHIPGLKNEIDSYRNQLAGKIYGKDTWARGGGDTVAAGTNITISTNSDGKKVITSTASAGGILAATGTVDGSNKSFTFTSAPSQVIVDGVAKQKTQSDGTVNWTGTTSITLTVAPVFDIYGIA